MKNKSEQEPWLEELQHKLKNYSETPRPDGWEKLEQDFFGTPPRRTIDYRRRWWSIAAAAALLTAVSGLSVRFLNSPEATDLQTAFSALPEPAAIKAPQPVIPVTGNELKSAQLTATAANTYKRQQQPVAEVAQTDQAEDQKTAGPVAPTGSPEKDGQSVPPKTEPRQTPQRNTFSYADEQTGDYPHFTSTDSSTGWSVSALIGNGGNMVNGQTAGRSPVLMSGTASYLLETTVENGMTTIREGESVYINELGYPEIRQDNQIINIKHHQPVTVGITFRKNLPHNFSVETGITYTLLTSDVQLSDLSGTASQKLHYIGVPVRANWTFMDRQFFSLYVSAGGSIEKCVSGKIAHRTIQEKPMQYSVLGALGAQINLTEHFGIYIEPGMSYFFDDGSKLNTIRKESPCNFNLQTGLRFSY